MKKTLQPCPNCGGFPKAYKRKNKFFYECNGDCWTQTKKYNTVEEAAEAWNKLKCESGDGDPQ